ncbi:hypothetical protein M569_14046, partial [Genlisea aurea]
FIEALSSYEKAIVSSPVNPAYSFNRSSALVGLKRFIDATKDCKEVLRIDPEHVQAHNRLGSLLLREQLCFPGGSRPNPKDPNMLQDLEQYMTNLSNYRRSDFELVLKEINENVHFRINSTPQVMQCKASRISLYTFDNYVFVAILTISHLHEDATTFSDSTIFGMISDSYILLGYGQ